MDFVAKQFDFRNTDRCIVIGELGVNHNREEELLFKLIDGGIEAGLDIIKFQCFVAEGMISKFAASADYQIRAGVGDNQLAMVKKLELPREWLAKAYDYCKARGVGFLCTAFEHDSVDFVAKKLGCRTIKVASSDTVNKPLLEHMAKLFDGMLISTGASTMDECRSALGWVQEAGAKEVALMHCLSEYPAPIEQVNLRAMVAMQAALGVPVGYSDHTRGHTAAVAAAALGAPMIEKHYTLDKNLPGPDHQASLDIAELKQLVAAVRDASASLGDGIKRPVAAESANLPIIRKTVVCAVASLKAGTKLETSMLAVKRPSVSGAVQPFELSQIIGKKLLRDKQHDEPLLWSDVA